MLISREQLGEDIRYHICRRQISWGDLARCEGVADEVIAYIDMFHTVMKLRVIGELHSSLIIHADCSRRRESQRRTCVFPRLPLHRIIIVILPYV